MSINIATRGMFPGNPIGIATSGKFNGPLIRILIAIIASRAFVSKTTNYFFVSKNATEK